MNALRVLISELKASDSLNPVTVIVPNNYVGIAARRTIASGQHGPIAPSKIGFAAVAFTTAYNLAELLGTSRLAAEGLRPSSTPIVAAVIRQVLSDNPGMFSEIAQHPSTERRLIAAHRELSDLSNVELDVLANQSSRARDIVRIHRSVTSLLSHSWYDEKELTNSARLSVESGTVSLDALGVLVLFAPERLSHAKLQLFKSIAEVLRTTAIFTMTGNEQADANVTRLASALGLNIEPSKPAVIPELTVTSMSDADDEVRHVIRGILEEASNGVFFDRMAIAYPSAQPYVRLLHDHLTAAEIPFNGTTSAKLIDTVAGQFLRKLLLLGNRGFRREDMLSLLSSSPISWDDTSAPTRAWARISRDLKALKGAEDWLDKLRIHIVAITAEIDRTAKHSESDWRLRHMRREINWTEGLYSFVDDLTRQLDYGSGLTDWPSLCQWAKSLLRRYLPDTEQWPHHETRSLELIDSILDQISNLEQIGASVSCNTFLRALEAELSIQDSPIGTFGRGVLVAPIKGVSGLNLERIWILGLNEGSFPSFPHEDSLLPDHERAKTGALAVQSTSTDEEHRSFLSALSSVGSEGTAHLSRPRGNLRRTEGLQPSRWLVDLVEQVSDSSLPRGEIDSIEEPWIHHTASFTAGLTQSSFPSTAQEFDTRSLLEHSQIKGSVIGHELLASDRTLVAGIEMQSSRAGKEFTRFDGNLTGLLSPVFAKNRGVTSATALETWARCPYRYFVQYVLHVNPQKIPRDGSRIDPLSRGNLIHSILERFVSPMISDHGKQHETKQQALSRLHSIAQKEFQKIDKRGLTGEALYWRREQIRILRELELFLDHDRLRRNNHCLAPVATELSFGFRNSPQVEVPLPSGEKLSIRGSIDLVDTDPAGNLVVIDYKTSRLIKLSEDNPHQRGTKLQLVLYAFAARSALQRADASVTSLYWHLRPDSNYDFTGYTVTKAVEAETIAAISTIVDNINRGIFVQHPEEKTHTKSANCQFCDPDGLALNDTRLRFLRKRLAPEVQEFLTLAEPELLSVAPPFSGRNND